MLKSCNINKNLVRNLWKTEIEIRFVYKVTVEKPRKNGKFGKNVKINKKTKKVWK